MVYVLDVYCDGACRCNGQLWAVGGAAAWTPATGQAWTQPLPNSEQPTNQRAELVAVRCALQLAIERRDQLTFRPIVDLCIFTDSDYVVQIFERYVLTWQDNGWLNSRGVTVANVDLIQSLWCDIQDFGRVTFEHIPRAQNAEADRLANEATDAAMQMS